MYQYHMIISKWRNRLRLLVIDFITDLKKKKEDYYYVSFPLTTDSSILQLGHLFKISHKNEC